jgi:phenylalanyl-tRNA synthetase beta chain
MRFSEAWLREWVNPPVDTQTLCAQLTMAGLEVDAVEPAAPAFSGVAIGLVLSAEPHPDAGKLRVCRVDAGLGEVLQIVCGAANVAAGMKVPVARVGAVLPGDLKIEQARLRGVESFGMICSASELGLAESSEGILSLPAEAEVGADLRAWLGLDDACVEVDLTPDRGDCLSLAGIAREVGVINRCPVAGPPADPVAPTIDDRFPVRLEAGPACPRYVCRVVRNVSVGAETPLWMRERLRRSGLRSLGPLVDVTNYVLLELGQPLHAFDLASLDGEIRVRLAGPGERLTLLNGDEAALRPDTLVIADSRTPVALAGIMGGAGSAVGEGTRDILLESAFFAPAAISGKARSYGLHTDSSHRFERGVDPGLQVHAIERATRLLLDLAGGEPGPVVEALSPGDLPRRRALLLRRTRIRQVLGLDLADADIEDILRRLGMEVSPAADGWEILPPSSRFDTVLEVDLIAEIGRIHGYDNIPIAHAPTAATTRAPAETAFDLDRARFALVGRGYQEVITYSFVSPDLQAMVAPGRPVLALANPISAELSVMRTSLWPGLLQAARQNLARQQERVRIFESGLRYLPEPGETGVPRQDAVLGGLVVGSVAPEQWGQALRAADFFDLKADVEALLGLTGRADAFTFCPAEHPALHPGQTACIELSGQEVGILGMLHPAVAARLDIGADVYVFELALEGLAAGRLPAFRALSKFPSIRRDIAIVVDALISRAQVEACIGAAEPDLLTEIVLFDVYQGNKIESGRKSLALGLILQASSQTLTDQEVDRSIARILARLESDIGARLRD